MNHEFFMQQALELAKLGWPRVVPNPLVGCVIVRNNEVVSSGYHEAYGGPHAEVVAVNNLPATVHPSECTVYVSLEPCSHQGKTPPCADLLIEKGFKTVVIACKDPNPLVAGNGIKKLANAGVEVVAGILDKEARDQNKQFLTFFEKKRPYIVLKWAITADGFISRIPIPKKREDNLITRQEAQVYVHRLRSELMGVLVGKNTVLQDDPRLTTRLVKGKNAVRLFIDRKLEVPRAASIYNNEAQTVVFNALKEEQAGHIRFVKIDFAADVLNQVCEKLYHLGIQSILVEGGAYLVNEFVKQDLWDEALVFQNPELSYGTGLKGPVFALKNTFELVGPDKLFHHFKNETLPAKGALSKEIF